MNGNQIAIADLADEISADDLTLRQALRLFETIYMPSRNLAFRTRKEYRADLKQLIGFLEKEAIMKPGAVSLSHLQSFLAYLDRRGFTGTTRRRKTSSIKAFFGFLTTNALISKDPTLQLIPPKREYREPRYLSAQEYRALLRACAHQTRDAAIIELFLQTGIRLSEAARLSIHDVELPARINRDPQNTGSITIKGKGRKQRTLPLNYKACRAIKAWLSVRPDIPEPGLFVSKFRAAMRPQAIQRAVKKYMEEASIKHASVHSLRHSFATHHVAKGTDLRTIQEALGHTDLKTTSVYVSTAKAVMRRDLQEHAL